MSRRFTRLVSRAVEVLRQIDEWPTPNAAAAVFSREGVLGARGDRGRVSRWASVTKLVTAVATLVAAEEGVVELDEPAGPEGSTVRHLLAHASGLPFEGTRPIAPPDGAGSTRIPASRCWPRHVAARGRDAVRRVSGGRVLRPLGLPVELRGSPASGLHGGLDGLSPSPRALRADPRGAGDARGGDERRSFPACQAWCPASDAGIPTTGASASSSATGRRRTGRVRNSPRTFGHFGGSGSFLWIDPEAGLGCACLTDRDFGDWALEAWPRLSDAVLEEAGARHC